MLLERPGEPLRLVERPVPEPGPGQLLVEVAACGVCRTDLHVADGELPDPRLPLVLGHEIVGRVAALGRGAEGHALGDRVGVPWLGAACGRCRFCAEEAENLCDAPTFTGYQADGGYADYALADARFCFPVAGPQSDAEAAPLLCAGLIGYRAWRMAALPGSTRIGLYGFGAAAHLAAQIARWEGREVYAFTRPGDAGKQQFARELGAVWAGGSDERPPAELDAAILFAPVGALVPAALAAVRKGGVVVAAGIHMSEIPAFPYELLWGERSLRSVANLTRRDGRDLLELAARIPLRSEIETLPLERADEALGRLRSGNVRGALVLDPHFADAASRS